MNGHKSFAEILRENMSQNTSVTPPQEEVAQSRSLLKPNVSLGLLLSMNISRPRVNAIKAVTSLYEKWQLPFEFDPATEGANREKIDSSNEVEQIVTNQFTSPRVNFLCKSSLSQGEQKALNRLFELGALYMNGPEITEEALKKSYRSLAIKWHPDLNPSPDASCVFRELCADVETLKQALSKKLAEANLI